MDDLIDGTSGVISSCNEISTEYPSLQLYKSSKVTEILTDHECKQPIPCFKRTNLIIWDFDDTIFPTYSFRTHQHKKDKEFMSKLKILVSLIEKIFLQMIEIYGSENIIIVTNGSDTWIYKCLNVDIVQKIFMNFQNLLRKHKIKTISASTTEIRSKFPKNHFKWKQIIFSQFFKQHFKDENKNMINSITSIGDSLCEYTASDISSKYISNRILNRIRFKPDPSINDMIFEMKETFNMLEQFGNNVNDIELDYCNIFTPGYYSSFSDTTC